MDRAITLGMTNSPFPASFDGSSNLFAFVLFAMIVASTLALTLAIMQAKQLWADRRFGYDPSWAINSAVLSFWLAIMMLCVPDSAYMISFGDALPATLQTILLAKRFMDVLFLGPLMYSAGVFYAWRADILLKLRSPSNVVHSDFKFVRITRFLELISLCLCLAVAVTLGRLYH